jgi:hypothetical protein
MRTPRLRMVAPEDLKDFLIAGLRFHSPSHYFLSVVWRAAYSMRFRKNFKITRIVLWMALMALMWHVAFTYSVSRTLELTAGWAMATLFAYCVQYWEVMEDRLVSRNFWTKRVLLYVDITYVGPADGLMTGMSATRRWIIVRGRVGRPFVVEPADRKGFIAEIRKFLPKVTHDLPD